ncbi:hypothetical protein Goshw_019286, partial [Gossypium schwendimanii]|nr:hypothetical protein [Gossypium schwendimanii]
MPVTVQVANKWELFRGLYESPVIKHFGDINQAGKRMELMFARPEIETPSGLKAASVSTSIYNEGLPLVSALYACSEAICGINLEPVRKPCDVSYTFLPNMAYFEFLPVKNERDGSIEMNSNNEDTELVNLVNVKTGQCYEQVVTTCA